jgi:acetyl esterase/lipase
MNYGPLLTPKLFPWKWNTLMPAPVDDRYTTSDSAEMVAQLAPLQPPPNPLHSSVKHRLHPQYVAFYNQYLLHAPQIYHLSVDEARLSGAVPPSHSKPLTVGNILDLAISRQETAGPNIPIRCFTPPGTPPPSGWPLVHFYHGGGWVFGDISTENTVCSHICVRSRAVVITTNYR